MSKAQRINAKRKPQLIKRFNKVLPEAYELIQVGKEKEAELLLKSVQVPSSKEWRKAISGLVFNAVENGILRAHYEIMKLTELYEFAEDDWKSVRPDDNHDNEVRLPQDAIDYLNNYSLQIAGITDDTILDRVRDSLMQSLVGGKNMRDTKEMLKDATDGALSDHQAMTIARTESAKMYNAGRIAKYLSQENNGFVVALQYDAIMDSRTTEICEHLDGKIIRIDEAAVIARMTPPNHFMCRSTWIPVTKYEDWEDDWDYSAKPEKSFDFEAPLPKLIKKQEEPLVQPKKETIEKPEQIKDIDKIRNLPSDDDFKKAIKNVDDKRQKLGIITERAEKKLTQERKLKEEPIENNIEYLGYLPDKVQASINYRGKRHNIVVLPKNRREVSSFFNKLQKAPEKEQAKLMQDFIDKHKGERHYFHLINQLRYMLEQPTVTMSWAGVDKVTQSPQAEKQFTFRTPPKTASYQAATGLRNAVSQGQKWIHNHVGDELAPRTGIQMHFRQSLDRAYATGANGKMYFGAVESSFGVIVHEAAHIMHWNNAEAAEMIQEFFDKRTEGFPEEYHHGEKVIRDHFYDPYVGRIYGWEEKQSQARNLSLRGQEIFSMGLQAMAENPEEFYQNDKEHFLLTYALMRGLF